MISKKGEENSGFGWVVGAIFVVVVIAFVVVFIMPMIPGMGDIYEGYVNDILEIGKDVLNIGVTKEKQEKDEEAKVVFSEIINAFENCINTKSDNCGCDFDVPELNEDYRVAMVNIRDKRFDLYLYDKNKQELGETDFPEMLVKFATSEPVKRDEPPITTAEESRRRLRYKCNDPGRYGIDIDRDNLYLHFRNNEFVLENGDKKIVGSFIKGLPRIYKNNNHLCFITDNIYVASPTKGSIELGGEDFYMNLKSCS